MLTLIQSFKPSRAAEQEGVFTKMKKNLELEKSATTSLRKCSDVGTTHLWDFVPFEAVFACNSQSFSILSILHAMFGSSSCGRWLYSFSTWISHDNNDVISFSSWWNLQCSSLLLSPTTVLSSIMMHKLNP